MADVIGWAATAFILVTYFTSGRSGNARPFHYANVIGAVILGTINARLGAWNAVALNVAFGLIAAYALVRYALSRRLVARLYTDDEPAPGSYAYFMKNGYKR